MAVDQFSFEKKTKKGNFNYVPEQPNQYQGRQIILNSDRILLMQNKIQYYYMLINLLD